MSEQPKDPQCTGPFTSAFDCPVHNPRKRAASLAPVARATDLARRCDDGHEWPADYTSGDTCECGELYLTQLPDGRMKVTSTT